MKIIDSKQKDIVAELKIIIDRGETATEEVAAAVKEVIERVRTQGDPAVLAYTEKFDRVKLTLKDIRVTPDEVKGAYTRVDPKKVDALKLAARNIRSFHEKQKISSWVSQEADGVILGQLARPIGRAGVYVPGGKACYPSSVLMNVIPAKVAGVEQIVMCSPVPGGALNPYILVAADIAGVSEIYKIGGAQAVAAMAYGTATVPKVDKIVGPGNIYVATAKRYVFGQVDIDMIAGPSEVLVIADDSAEPSFVAADLLSQAEHDELASAILVTTSRALAERVNAEMGRQMANLVRKEIARKAIDRFGAIVIVENLKDAAEVSNAIAPEHLELSVENPFELLALIKNAGAIFLGHFTPESVGDYVAGPNHVLPTGGTARFFSPLSTDSFMKRSSLIFYTKEGLDKVGEAVMQIADVEGLEAHGNTIRIRMAKK
ncbi:MAG: histidinol dehydrogenase [Nitrospirae bacterium]|nr:histidinol dehydrogenase [Nitrospirota bacterium]NTW66372.1 histidinol dehydrogenase [Nitrospirota bacterium]